MEMVLIKINNFTFNNETELIDLSSSISYSGNDILSTDINNLDKLIGELDIKYAIFNQESELEKCLKKMDISYSKNSKFIILQSQSTNLYKQLLKIIIEKCYSYIFSVAFIISDDINYFPSIKKRKIIVKDELAIVPYYEDDSVFIINGRYNLL